MPNIRRVNIIVGQLPDGALKGLLVTESGVEAESAFNAARKSGDFAKVAHFRGPTPYLVKDCEVKAAVPVESPVAKIVKQKK